MLSRGTRTTQAAGRLAIDRYTCASRAGVAVAVGRITQKRWASNKGADSERPFYLQLQESIQERVQKEKAEQLAIQQMQQRTARGQFWATVTGECLKPSAGVLPAGTRHAALGWSITRATT